MAKEYEKGAIRILASRSGLVSEVNEFLTDLNNAYVALYVFEARFHHLNDPFWRFQSIGTFSLESGYVERDNILPPNDRLLLNKVRIESPGFWEFLGAKGVLEAIRMYINDCHERRKDRDYRNAAERRKLDLENDALWLENEKRANEIIAAKLKLLEEHQVPRDEIYRLAWTQGGMRLAQLAKYEQSGLISGATPAKANREE